MFSYKVSVVIPIYNSEELLHFSIDSLLAQKMDFSDIEVLLVNNGSVDGSEELCLSYAKKYDNVKYFSINEKGVSFARNYGIEHATGKYIGFLDSDDALTPDTLSKIYDFFEKHYDETDIVTYKIVPYFLDGRKGTTHWRYWNLKKTGVYDLEEPDNWFITQTTVNVFVKNMGTGNNILFDVDLAFHEDQRYDLEVELSKRTIGFVKGPEYKYIQHLGSVTNFKEHPFYIFEDTTALWESLFARFTEVPHYIQALYVNDLSWKINRDHLLPYHYSDEEFSKARGRHLALLSKVDPKVILGHPVMKYNVKFYLLKLKGEEVTLDTSKNIELFLGDEQIHLAKTFTVEAQRMKLIDYTFATDLSIVQVANFYSDDGIKFFVVKDGKREELPLLVENYDFFKGAGVYAPHYYTRVKFDIRDVKEFYFEVEAFGKVYRPNFIFAVNDIFNQRKIVNAVYREKTGFKFIKRGSVFKRFSRYSPYGLWTTLCKFFWDCVYFLVRTNIKVLLNRWSKVLYKQKHPVWLYCDVENVFDNAYMQFMHDFSIADGVDRYYCIHKSNLDRVEELFPGVPKEKIIIAESKQHKGLFLNCNKVITGYSNLGNICPFGAQTMRWYYDLLNFEVVYLQHGILHASLQNMYGHNHCQVDRVVVSSGFEVENFTNDIYRYKENELIKSCMPRYDFIRREAEKENKVLFAPSWRQNLVGELKNGVREVKDDLFLKSDFYKATQAFLSSPELAKTLEEHDLYLDFKNHPNFACYNHLFEIDNPRIRLIEDKINMDEYKLMITDYSSMVFDAVYIGCPILYFVPDYEQFIAGVSHGYRALDLPLSDAFGPFAQTADELLSNFETCAAADFVPAEPYKSRMEGFFLHYDDCARDRLYEALK